MGREAAEGLEPSPEVAGREEVGEGEASCAVGPSGMPNVQLGVVVVVVSLDDGVPDRAVHPRDLAVRPRVVGLGQAVLDAIGRTDPVEAHWPGIDAVA